MDAQVFSPSPSNGAIKELNKHVERIGENFERLSPGNFINEKMEVGATFMASEPVVCGSCV